MNLLPVSTMKELEKVMNDLIPCEGFPRKTRFNGSDGIIFDHWENTVFHSDELSRKGKVFQIVPIAYGIYTADLYAKGPKKWGEIYYINQEGSFCYLHFHEYSVDAFMDTINRAKHLRVESLVGIPLEITFDQKHNNESNSDYYILNFTPIKKYDKAMVDALNTIASEQEIYSQENVPSIEASMPVLGFNFFPLSNIDAPQLSGNVVSTISESTQTSET